MSTFIFINPPPNLEFGIDFNQWTVGPNFKGLKLISPGLHFLHYHLLSSNQTGFISGFFHRFEEDQVIVWKWNASIEDWQPEEDVEQLKRVNDSVANQEMDRFLGYPPLNPTSKWHGLSHLISGRILDQIMPNTKSISAMTTSSLHSQLWSEARKADLDLLSAAPLLTDNLDGKKFVNFTPISLKLSFPPNSTPDEITKHSLDKSYLLDITIDQNYHSPLDLLGELQLSFIMFHLGQFYDGFEQWKVLLDLLLQQLAEFPPDFFHTDLSSESFLHEAISNLYENLSFHPGYSRKIDEIDEFLTQQFNWDIKHQFQDLENDGPTVVD